MNKIQESLEANKAEILKALPKEFQADFEKEAAQAAEPTVVSGAEEVAAIKAELAANPAVDENAAAGELTNIQAPAPVTPPTEAELETEKAQALKAMDAAKD